MEMKDNEILDFKIGEKTVREVTAITFLGWIAGKLNGVAAYSAASEELRLAVAVPPYGQMPELEKVRLFRKLLSLGIQV